MGTLEFLKRIYGLVKTPNKDSLALSLADTHHKGIFSLVIDGNEFGKLTRVFISDIKLKPFEVQLHTHRYPLRITTIKGNIAHHIAIPQNTKGVGSIELSKFDYKSPLNGGSGLNYTGQGIFLINEHSLPVGSMIEMTENDYHTMSCSKGSIWVVEEMGFKTDKSSVLGVPFIIDGLYNEPKMFQVNDKCQHIAKEIKKLILDYEIVS